MLGQFTNLEDSLLNVVNSVIISDRGHVRPIIR